MKNVIWTSVFALFTAASAAASEPLVLEKMGVMFVGGREVAMTSAGRFGGGNQIVDQAPVHFLIPPEEKRQSKSPIVMIPGMGLTSYLYLGTPDGREGWAQIFAKAGHPVYVFDEPGNAISGFEVGKITASETPPRIMLWSNEITWRRWGIGPEARCPRREHSISLQAYRSTTRFDDAGHVGWSRWSRSWWSCCRSGRRRRISTRRTFSRAASARTRRGRFGRRKADRFEHPE